MLLLVSACALLLLIVLFIVNRKHMQDKWRLSAVTEKLDEKAQSVEKLEVTNRGLHEENQYLREKVLRLETLLEEEKKQVEDKLSVLSKAEEKFTHVFKSLSGDVLKSQNESFMQLASKTLEKYQEGAKGELDKKQSAIKELLSPVKESLERFDKKVNDLEKSREGAYQGLKEQVKSLIGLQENLRKETSDLVKALRSPVVRGRWGEIQLKRVVELAGMLEYCDFVQQKSVTDGDERLRPDLIVNLPGGRNIVVDAKAPLLSYLEAYQTKDEDEKNKHMAQHAKHVRTHMAQLSKKSYWEQFQPTPEFVVLFLPGEVFFSSALEHDPSLIELGVEQGVILATPTTLIALLRAISYGWNQDKISKNAEDVCNLGKELYKRLLDMSGHWDKMGKSLNQSVQAYNKAVGSLESRVLVSARKFQEMGIGKDKDIGISKLDSLPKELSLNRE